MSLLFTIHIKMVCCCRYLTRSMAWKIACWLPSALLFHNTHLKVLFFLCSQQWKCLIHGHCWVRVERYVSAVVWNMCVRAKLWVFFFSRLFGYLKACKQMQKKYLTNTVIFAIFTCVNWFHLKLSLWKFLLALDVLLCELNNFFALSSWFEECFRFFCLYEDCWWLFGLCLVSGDVMWL